VAGSQETIAHLDRPQYLLGYMPDQSKLYLTDREHNITSWPLHLALVEYQSAIMRKDFTASEKHFADVPESLHNRLARFLENQGYAMEALAISKDDDHRFELATQLGRLQMAADIITSMSEQAAASASAVPPRAKWKSLGDVALEQGDIQLARRCFTQANDIGSLFLLQTSCGDAVELAKTASMARDSGITNVACICYLLLGDTKSALQVLIQAKRLPEAAFFARSYCPSELPEVVNLWKADLAQVNQAVADSLADPARYPDLFPGWELALAAEKTFRTRFEQSPPVAGAYLAEKKWLSMDVLDEVRKLTPEQFNTKILRGAPTEALPEAPPKAPPEAPAASAAAAPPPETVVDGAGSPEMTPMPEAAEAGPESTP